jgi:hypothetical protein
MGLIINRRYNPFFKIIKRATKKKNGKQYFSELFFAVIIRCKSSLWLRDADHNSRLSTAVPHGQCTV